MVRLLETSSVSSTQPILHEWDSLVRKNYNMYQKLIEAKTYQLQRVQRYILSLRYPLKYDSDLITLNLLKKKQRVGEVTKQELEMYKSINPCISCHFNKTFSTSIFDTIPKLGVAVGAGLFLYGSMFNFSIPTRFMYFVLPVVADYFWTRRNPKSEVASSQFLDWVFEYRKAKVFNERHKHLFNSPETHKILGQHGNLTALGDQLVKLAA